MTAGKKEIRENLSFHSLFPVVSTEIDKFGKSRCGDGNEDAADCGCGFFDRT